MVSEKQQKKKRRETERQKHCLIKVKLLSRGGDFVLRIQTNQKCF